jgi:hypothetical protein
MLLLLELSLLRVDRLSGMLTIDDTLSALRANKYNRNITFADNVVAIKKL